MKAKFVYENIRFERGVDPKEALGVGLDGYLKGKSLQDIHDPERNSRRAAAELGAEFEYDIDLSKIYYLGRLDAGKITESPDWAIKRLLPYLTEDNMLQGYPRNTGAGTVIRSYATPYGKVVFEGLYGFPPHGTGWAKREVIKNLMADKMNESVRFERGIEPKTAMGLGEVEIELDYHNFYLDEDTGEPDLSQEDTAYALQELKDSGLKFEFERSSYGPVLVKLKGARSKMAPFVAEYLDEPVEDIENAMRQWDGKDERDFWKLAGY